MRICVIFNPTARGQKAERFRTHLREVASACELKPTTCAGAGRALAAEAVREEFDVIVAAGGDGTLNEVLNGIADEPGGLTRCRLGLLPLGTVNVFAKEMGIPTRFRDAWQVILQSHEVWIDLPAADFDVNNQSQRRYFAQMAGAGLDARAVELVDWRHKKRFGQAAYGIAAFRALLEGRATLRVTIQGNSVDGEQVLIGNGRFYAGPYPFFPLAEMQDGLLEATVFPKVNWSRLGQGAWGLMTQQFYQRGGVHHLRSASITVSSEQPAGFHLEGEHVGRLPVTFSMPGTKLRVIVPVQRLSSDARRGQTDKLN